MTRQAQTILPPLPVMNRWRNEGYTPQEVYKMAREYVANIRRVIREKPQPVKAPLPLRVTLPLKPLAKLESGFLMVMQAIVDTATNGQSNATAIAAKLKLERLEVQQILVRLYRAGYVQNLRRPSLTEAGMEVVNSKGKNPQ